MIAQVIIAVFFLRGIDCLLYLKLICIQATGPV